MSGDSSKIIAFNYFGGKFTMLNNLYFYFPDKVVNLVDVFAGSFCVSLNYKGRCIKTANEINEEITNFFQVLRDREDELVRMLLLTPCSEAEYKKCWESCECDLERARRFYVRVRQSFFGLGAQRKNKGWHMAKSHVNAQGGETVSRWNNAIEKLHEVAEVIRSNFQITAWDFRTCIKKLDTTDTFFYQDPPYPEEVRASKNDYRFEFTEADHRQLAEINHSVKGKVMISSYDGPLYNDLYANWNKVKFPVKKNNIRSSEVQEVIWMNYTNKPNFFN